MSALSYVCGASDVPLLFKTVGGVLEEAARLWPNREALVVRHQLKRLSYRQLNERADTIAAGLLAIGFQPNDRIGIWAPNCLEWVLTQFASAKAGLILVNLNPAYRLAEVEYALAKTGCRGLVTADTFKSSNYIEMLSALIPETARSDRCGEFSSARLPALKYVIHLGKDSISGFFQFSELESLARREDHNQITELRGVLQPDDPVNIQFTSGTTGRPKGATLSHFNIVNNGFFVARTLGLSEQDRMCIPVPLYHCFGMVMGNLGCVTHGATMVYPNDAFDAQRTLETLTEERCTVLYGVTTMFIAQLEHPALRDANLTRLRTGVMAGAPCPIEVMKRVLTEMHMPEVTIAYGMTETSPVSFQTHLNESVERRVSTVGRVHPHAEVKIVDALGRVVPRGATGELCTRGYSVMRGYWGDPELTDEVIDTAGWMHTGDLASLDSEGYCNINGRLKDLIIRGGEKLSPREIEDLLFRHPKVQLVQVFGVPDPRCGEEACAWIQLRDSQACTVEEIRAFCRGQIAHQKIPRYVRFVEEFPMTVTGKIQKFAMRERRIQELNLKTEKTA
jgi:fatty-acyl-CoA synthase